MVRVLAVIFAVCIILLLAFISGEVARRKGRPFWLYFAAAVVVGPLALFGALLLPNHRRLG
jgi:hypothetical protein